MAKRNNKDKSPVDESILDEIPPNINEPQKEEDDPENQDVASDSVADPPTEDKPEVLPKEELTPSPVAPITETPEQKEQKFKAQQTEAQIQAARARALSDKVDEAANLPDPTEEELRIYVASRGANYDDLTPFEQSMAKETYLSKKQFHLVNEAVQTTKKIDEWAGKVDTFIDATDGKPEFVSLSGHEAEFRKFCMKEAHRGVAIDTLLLPAFLQNLPKTPSKRGSLFQSGGGGDAPESKPGEITDADQVVALRMTNPREYARQLKAGKIKLDV